MSSVREIEARLAGQVEDKVLERLGYREYKIVTPLGEIIEPRPDVSEMTTHAVKRQFGEQILTELATGNRPATIWKVAIPRTYTPQQIRIEGVWQVHPDDELAVDCYPLTIERFDARWVVYLTPQRRGSLI